MKRYEILPIPKPRMSRQDAWKKRDCVVRYWNFKAHCKLLDLKLPEGAFAIDFILPMPKSWSAKKRAAMLHKPHQQKPDIDNLLKAQFDAVFDDDCHIAQVQGAKWWGEIGCIYIREIAPFICPEK